MPLGINCVHRLQWSQCLFLRSNWPKNCYLWPNDRYLWPNDRYLWPNNRYLWPNGTYRWPNNRYLWPNDRYLWPNNRYLWPNGTYRWPNNRYLWPDSYLWPNNSLWPNNTYQWPNDRYLWPSDGFPRVKHLLHLGHPLPACFDLPSAFELVQAELSTQIAELHAQLIQLSDRILLANTMILPKLSYRTKCLPLSTDQLIDLSSVVERFVLGVTSLPPLVTKKTLHTHRRHGLGLSYFPVLHPTRVLNALHRNSGLPEFATLPSSCPCRPLIYSSLQLVGWEPPTTLPLPILWKARSTIRDAIAVLSISGSTVYLLPHLVPRCHIHGR